MHEHRARARRAIRALPLLAAALPVIAAAALLGRAAAQAPVAISEVPRAALAGPVPASGVGIVVAFAAADAAAVRATLSDAGCAARSIAVHRGGWLSFVYGAPAAANAAFPASLPPATAVWVRCEPAPALVDPANAGYEIEGTAIALVAGRSEIAIVPGSATRLRTSLTEHQAFADLDGVARVEAASVLVHDPGGSGTFVYLAVVQARPGRPVLAGGGVAAALPAVHLGDRVRVRLLAVEGDLLRVDYLAHAPGQALAEPPAVLVTRRFALAGSRLVEVSPAP